MNTMNTRRDYTEPIREAVRSLMDALNRSSTGARASAAVAEELEHTHRTLQQEYMRTVVVPTLQKLAEMGERGAYDARNEASCRLAQRLLEAVKDDDDLMLPFI